MNREQFIKAEDKHVTVRIMSADGGFNRLLNTIPAPGGASFQALEQDLAGVESGMTVKLPEGKRAVVQNITAGEAGVGTVALTSPELAGNKTAVAESPAPLAAADKK